MQTPETGLYLSSKPGREFYSFSSHRLSIGFGSVNNPHFSGEDTERRALQGADTELTPALRLHHCSLTFQLRPQTHSVRAVFLLGGVYTIFYNGSH